MQRRPLDGRPCQLEASRESRKLPAGQPFRDQFGMEDAIFIPGASADYPITIFHLAGINVVRFCAAVLLTHP